MKNEKIKDSKKSWQEVILDDFKAFTEKNISHPDMKKIITTLETGKPSKECINTNKLSRLN